MTPQPPNPCPRLSPGSETDGSVPTAVHACASPLASGSDVACGALRATVAQLCFMQQKRAC